MWSRPARITRRLPILAVLLAILAIGLHAIGWDRVGRAILTLVRGIAEATWPAAACLSTGYLSRVFRHHFGIGPVSALELLRLSRAAMLLARSNLSAEAIAHDCGFANPTPTTSRAGSTASTASHPAATAAPLE